MNELIVTDSISLALFFSSALCHREIEYYFLMREKERERVKRPISPRDNERDDAVNSWRQV